MGKKYILLAFFIALLSFQWGFSQNAIWYVSANGTGNGSSWTQSSSDLQAIINNAVSGDQVWVKQGSYQRNVGLSFALKDGVSVYGGFPNIGNPTFLERNPKLYETILNGNEARVLVAAGVLESLSAATIFDGFTIQSGNDTAGAGMQIYNCDATFRNLTVTNNTSSMGLGAGISITNSNSTFIQVLVHHNTSVLTPGSDGDSAGIRINGGNLKFYNCVIADNHAQGYIGGLWVVTANVWFYNSIIYGNTADLEFSTFTEDNYNAGTGVNFYASNCILEHCRGSDYRLEALQYTIYGIDLGGNLDIDPEFTSDYAAQALLSVNKGNTAAYEAAENATATDFFSNSRIVDVIDIGLSENQSVQSEIFYVKENGTGSGSSWADASGDLQLMMDRQLKGREIWVAQGTYFAPELYFKLRDSVKVYGGFPPQDNPVFADRNTDLYPTVLTSVHSAVIGNFYPPDRKISRATLLDGFVITNTPDSPVYMYGIFDSNSNVTYSNVTFTGLNYGAADIWRSSDPLFSDCIFTDNIAINIEGEYYPNTITMLDGAKGSFIRCSFTYNNAFNGSAIYAMGNSDVFLDECYFAHNEALGVGKVVVIEDSAATITNTVFDSNGYSASDGGILFAIGTAADTPSQGFPLNLTIDRCIFKNNLNSAFWYQGKDGDKVSINNSLFLKNTGSAGGGIRRHYGGDLYVTNSTFTENYAENPVGGAIFMSDSGLGIPLGISEIRNSIIYNNTALYTYAPEIWTYRPIRFRNTILRTSGGSSNWDAGVLNDFDIPDMAIDLGGNLDIDPMFTNAAAENYKPLAGSPAINSGDNSLFASGAVPDLSGLVLDIDGNPRILDNIIDIGAYEFDPELGMDPVTLNHDVWVYPNPSSGQVRIHSSVGNVTAIKIIDVTGKEVLTASSENLDVADLATGIYIIHVAVNQDQIFKVKFIKK